MAEQQQQNKKIGFKKSILLFKDQTLGIGSYGAVCKAKCDDLLCAAKIIHPTLFNPTALHQITPHREHRLPSGRFQQECEFLSTIHHPNIVQYLGKHQDPDTGLPVLLMELMDDSLTHFLEVSQQPIPYHLQVNICHDITLALSFLHSNSIVHRDLSSSNVLLIGNVKAKVSDFGMARLGDQATQLTFTMCPGTEVYMPPEAVQDKPVYTEKIDCFSFGVITVQIITRQFPKPGNRRKKIQINQPGLPPIVEVPVSEIERRQHHIGEIDPSHPLKQVALDCLKDKDIERPSAQQLCERVAALKEDPQYSESVRAVEARSAAELDKRDKELRSLIQQHSEHVQDLQHIIQMQISKLTEKDQAIIQKDEIIAKLTQQVEQLESEKIELRQRVDKIDQLERQMERINQHLKESERINARFQRRTTELEQLQSTIDISCSSKEKRASIELTWRQKEKAICKMSDSYCAALDGSTLYVRLTGTCQVFGYTVGTSSWSQLPDSPTSNCSSIIINNFLTFVGGYYSGALTNKLFSLTGEGSGRGWTEKFPPMPTKRRRLTTLCTEKALIVAGGWGKDGSKLQVVEVLNTETLQWSTAADLPQPVALAPAAICDDIYIIGESSMYTCSVSTLIQSCKSFLPSIRNRSARVWKAVASPPVTRTTCVSIDGRLLAIGGLYSDNVPTTAVHMYNPTKDSWEVIIHMGIPRYDCIAAVLPNNRVMVVGGYTVTDKTDSIEFVTVE